MRRSRRSSACPTKQVSMDWQVAIRNAYEPILKAGSGETGTLVIEGKELGADLNVGPAISPDGRWIAFLSTRSFFSVDLYVAEAVTGKIVRRLTSQATNPHFSSVQFIQSTGAWDSASQKIAVATVTSGRAALAIFDALNGGVDSRDRDPGRRRDHASHVGAGWPRHLLHRDASGHHRSLRLRSAGQSIATAHQGCVRRSAAVVVAGRPAHRVLDRSILEQSDDARVRSVYAGQHRSREWRRSADRRRRPKAKHINPQWAPDGRSIYFISDRDGIPNIYRTTVGESAETTQVTHVTTGDQRDHEPEPGDERGVEGRERSPSACIRTASTTSGRRAQRLRVRRCLRHR